MGVGRENQDGSELNFNDSHVWLVDENGNIIDPTPPAYQGERHYKPFKFNQKKYFNYYWNKYMKQTKEQRKAMVELLYQVTVDRNCGFNAIAYWKKHKNCKIVVGSLGFEIGKGRIFWEFG